METQLFSERVQIERKQFLFDFKENANGRFLKITEEVGGHRDAVIIPASGLPLFRETIERVMAANA
ncbi:MAG: DNA-binding protein [Kiritimatiellia bacterium]